MMSMLTTAIGPEGPLSTVPQGQLQIVLLVSAAACFTWGLLQLARGNDVLAVLSCATGALGVRALHLATRAAEAGR